jgi:hypothetical protein
VRVPSRPVFKESRLESRYEKDLARVGIFHFRTGRVSFDIHFTRIRRVRANDTSRFTGYLRGDRVVLRLRRRHRRRGGKSIWRRSFFRCRLRRIFGHDAYWGGWTRNSSIAVSIPSASCFWSACCLTSNQRHAKSNRSQENEGTDHREMYRSALVHQSSNDNRNPGEPRVPQSSISSSLASQELDQ